MSPFKNIRVANSTNCELNSLIIFSKKAGVRWCYFYIKVSSAAALPPPPWWCLSSSQAHERTKIMPARFMPCFATAKRLILWKHALFRLLEIQNITSWISSLNESFFEIAKSLKKRCSLSTYEDGSRSLLWTNLTNKLRAPVTSRLWCRCPKNSLRIRFRRVRNLPNNEINDTHVTDVKFYITSRVLLLCGGRTLL